MPHEEDFNFSFVSRALPEDTFTVAEWKGTEGLSMLYEFEITLYAEDPEIDLKAVLQNPATLTIIPEGEEERKIHGIPAVFEQLHEYDDYIYYRLKLVPRLWIADQYHENMLFLDKKVPEIIEEILKQAGLTSQDYELKLTGSYQPWEYVCQYNETDFDFISRWMEREGIYYYFDQSGDAEKLIITDSSTAHQSIEGGAVTYSPPGQITASVFEQVKEFTCRQQILPQKVVLKDYNYRKPSLDLKGEADVDSEGRGNVYIYGEHFKTPEEGNALAKIRSEELLCREVLFYGESTVSPFLPGFLFELEEHYRDSYNKKYLMTEVTHQGVQAEFLAMAAGTSRITELEGPAYENRFTCIPDTPQFRPERKTVKPRIDGTLNAKVDAAGDDQYAEIDDEGRYKVKLPFDQSDTSDGKASRWTRMAQPYAGADYGMHFPLHKGVEVLLTFIDGDPDRPIIVNSVPNPETASPVTSSNHTQSKIQTNYGHNFIMDDANPHWEINTADGCQMISDDSDHSISIVTPGNYEYKSSDTDQMIYIATPGMSEAVTLSHNTYSEIASGSNYFKALHGGKIELHAEQEIHADVGGSNLIMKGDHIRFWNGGFNVRVDSGQIKLWQGANVIRIADNEIKLSATKVSTTSTNEEWMNIAHDNKMHAGTKNELFLGQKSDTNIAGVLDTFVGLKIAINAAATLEMCYGIKAGNAPLDTFNGNLKIFNITGVSLDKSQIKLIG